MRDGGIEGVVIRLAGRAWGQVTADGDTITAGAGALDSMVARASAKADPTVVDAEYRVVRKAALPQAR